MRVALTAALATCLAVPAWAKPKPHDVQGPVCVTATEALADVKADGGTGYAALIAGDRAAKLVKAINETGDPTSFVAQSVVVRIFDDHVGIALFNPCYFQPIRMSFKSFGQALKAARSDGDV